jgi:hypothetical protein
MGTQRRYAAVLSLTEAGRRWMWEVAYVGDEELRRRERLDGVARDHGSVASPSRASPHVRRPERVHPLLPCILRRWQRPCPSPAFEGHTILASCALHGAAGRPRDRKRTKRGEQGRCERGCTGRRRRRRRVSGGGLARVEGRAA